MAFGVNIGKIKTYYLTTYYHLDLGTIKHIKEFRQQSFELRTATTIGGNNTFVFGKQNSFFVLRAGFGQKRYFSEKAKQRGLAVGISYEAGPSIGLLKPYYLDLRYPIDNGTSYVARSEKYSEQNHDIFLEQSRIRGHTGFTKGLGEISPVVGLHVQAAGHFGWGAFDEFVKAMEAGIMVDFFTKTIPIMVDVEGVENSPVFINFFLNLQLGKRR